MSEEKIDYIETWEDIEKASNKALIAHLKKRIGIFLKRAKLVKLVIALEFDDIIKEIEKRLGVIDDE